MRIAYDGVGYDNAAEALVGANQLAALYYNGFRGKAAGWGAMAGDDRSSEDFVREYDGAAQTAIDAVNDVVDSFAALGILTSSSSTNHRHANAGSVYGKPPIHDGSQPLGDGVVDVPAVTLPSALGGDNQDFPEWWNVVVDFLQGWAWPNADTGTLRTAASEWRGLATQIEGLESYCDSGLRLLSAQRSPEIPLAEQAIRDVRTEVANLGAQLRALGDACEGYAEAVEQTRETIRDLMRDLAIEAAATATISAIGSFFTFGGAAAVGAGVIAARAGRYAWKIIAALRALKAIHHVQKTADAFRKMSMVRRALARFKDARSLMKASQAVKRMPTVARKPLNLTKKQLQKKYKHAEDFGLPKNYTPKNAEELGRRLDDFMKSPDTLHRAGTYRGQPAQFAFNPTTGKLVLQHPDGSLWSVWNLSPRQLMHVIRDGKLGGG